MHTELLAFPPHATKPKPKAINNASMACHLRRRAGIPNSNKQASAAPPPAYHGGRLDEAAEAEHGLEAAVVAMVSVALPAAPPVTLTGVVAPKLKVGRLTAPLGLEVTTAVRTTLPVKALAGVMLTVEASPVVAPAATDTAVPVIAKLGGGATGVSVVVAETLDPNRPSPG